MTRQGTNSASAHDASVCEIAGLRTKVDQLTAALQFAIGALTASGSNLRFDWTDMSFTAGAPLTGVLFS